MVEEEVVDVEERMEERDVGVVDGGIRGCIACSSDGEEDDDCGGELKEADAIV